MGSSPEERAREARGELRTHSGGKIDGLLIDSRARAFESFVEQAIAQGCDREDFARFARTVKSGEARAWWCKSFSLSALCNIADDERSACFGLSLGIEQAREIERRAVEASQREVRARVEPKPAQGRPLTLDEMRAQIGAMPWKTAAGGGS